MGGAEPRSLI